jgi:hypothetical protein
MAKQKSSQNASVLKGGPTPADAGPEEKGKRLICPAGKRKVEEAFERVGGG